MNKRLKRKQILEGLNKHLTPLQHYYKIDKSHWYALLDRVIDFMESKDVKEFLLLETENAANKGNTKVGGNPWKVQLDKIKQTTGIKDRNRKKRKSLSVPSDDAFGESARSLSS